MAHLKHVSPAPHPQNPARTHTLLLNTGCPRCGGDIAGLALEPDSLLHCPHCHGALESLARMEDGGRDRTANVVTIAWLAPGDFGHPAGPECDCAGCESTRPPEGR